MVMMRAVAPKPREYVIKHQHDDFPVLLREFRDRAVISRNALAHEVGVDPSYLTRIEHGDREPPRKYIIDCLARALRLTVPERNRLLVSAGYAPLCEWDDVLQDVSGVLNDGGLSPEELAEFRSVVRLISARWRGSVASPTKRLASQEQREITASEMAARWRRR